jgi:uncharacterized membrane protein
VIFEHSIHIAAPVETVWAVTEDVARWPEWTPTMRSVRRVDDGPFQVGSAARIKQPGMPEAVWTVTELVRGERFTWGGRALRIRMRATHELAPDGSGTRNVLRVEMSGFVAALLSPLLRPAVRRALRQENEGLKARCEGLAR